MKRLTMRNQQREVPLVTQVLRRQTQWLLEHALAWPKYEIGIYFINSKRMTALNECHLSHEGPTDILTFDYKESIPTGEIFICPKVAEENARQYRTTLHQEIARYLIHGLLHMNGYDDKTPGDRRKMKREENRLLCLLHNNG